MRIALRSASVTLLTWVALCALWLPFAHLDMTYQRLLVTFWREYLIMGGALVVAIVLEVTRARITP